MKLNRSVIQRVVGEFLIIIAGVLAAFQVESWREGREALEREQAQLRALAADFEENEDRLAADIARQRRTIEAVSEFLLIANGDVEPPADDSLMTLWIRSHQFQRFEPVTGAYDALVSSGDLRLLRSQPLRSALADFSGAAGDGYEDQAMSDGLHVQLIREAAERAPLWQVARPFMASLLDFSGEARPVDFSLFHGDTEYMGVLAMTGTIEGLHLRYFENLLARIQNIRALLAEQIN